MTIEEKQNLEFFNSLGDNLNLAWLDTFWFGNIYVPRLSTNLFEISHIFLYDKLRFNGNSILGKFQSNSIAQDIIEIWAYWKNDEFLKNNEIFLYETDLNKEIQVVNNTSYDTDEVNYYSNITDNRKNVTNLDELPTAIKVGIKSNKEGIFRKTLIIASFNQTTEVVETIAEIEFYAEIIGEDERLPDLLTNIGFNFPNSDFKIFNNTDPNEIVPDWQKINRKRKEALLTSNGILNYLMSYKGLINAIRFYGYNLGIKEYWKNINPQSENFNKYKLINVIDKFEEEIKLLDDLNGINVPNKVYVKTNFLQLIYRINEIIPDEFDSEGLPIVREVSTFSVNDVLTKLFWLKKKLNTTFLPVNIKIIDIVAEADYFAKINTVTYNIQNETKFVQLTENPKIDVVQGRIGFIEDLKYALFNVSSSVDLVDGKKFTIGELNALAPTILDFEKDTKFDYKKVRNLVISNGIIPLLNNNFELFQETFISYFINNTEISRYADNEGVPCGYLCDLKVINFPEYTFKDLKNVSYADLQSFQTYENLQYGLVYEIEWKIKKQVTQNSPSPFEYSVRGSIIKLNTLKVILPFIGYYDVDVSLYDLHGNTTYSFNKSFIEVKSLAVNFLGIYKEPYRDVTYALDGKKTYKELTGTYERPYTSDLTYEDCDVSYLSFNQANFSLKPTFTELDSYTYKNLRLAKYEDVRHLSYDNTQYAIPSKWVTYENFGLYTYAATANLTYSDLKLSKIYSDIPTSFPIYKINNVDDTSNFPLDIVTEIGNNIRIINKIEDKTFNYGLVNYLDLVEVENFLTALRLFFNHYDFNPTYLYDNSPIPVAYGLDRIIVTAKRVAHTYDCQIEYWTSKVNNGTDIINYNNNGLLGSLSGNLYMVNMDYQETNLIIRRKTIKNYTQVLFVADNCKIPGKNTYVWTMKNEDTNEIINFEGQYFNHLFLSTGEYSIALNILDSNGNFSTGMKNGFINVVK